MIQPRRSSLIGHLSKKPKSLNVSVGSIHIHVLGLRDKTSFTILSISVTILESTHTVTLTQCSLSIFAFQEFRKDLTTLARSFASIIAIGRKMEKTGMGVPGLSNNIWNIMRKIVFAH